MEYNLIGESRGVGKAVSHDLASSSVTKWCGGALLSHHIWLTHFSSVATHILQVQSGSDHLLQQTKTHPSGSCVTQEFLLTSYFTCPATTHLHTQKILPVSTLHCTTHLPSSGKNNTQHHLSPLTFQLQRVLLAWNVCFESDPHTYHITERELCSLSHNVSVDGHHGAAIIVDPFSITAPQVGIQVDPSTLKQNHQRSNCCFPKAEHVPKTQDGLRTFCPAFVVQHCPLGILYCQCEYTRTDENSPLLLYILKSFPFLLSFHLSPFNLRCK